MTEQADTQIELDVISGLLNRSDSALIDMLSATDFSDSRCQELFYILRDYKQKHVAPDLNMVLRAYAKRYPGVNLQEAKTFFNGYPDQTEAVLSEKVSILIERTKQREVHELISTASTQPVLDADNSIDKVITRLKQIQERKIDADTFFSMKNLAAESVEYLTARGENQDQLLGLSYGINELDRLTLGAVDADLIVLAGRPSMGKTAAALTFARHFAKKVPGVFFSLEMPRLTIYNRMIAQLAQLNMQKIMAGTLEDDQWSKYSAAMTVMNDLPLYIEDTPGLTYKSLINKAEIAHKKYGARFIIIDYLQLMGGNDNTEAALSRISSELKALARNLEIPVLLLSQLNRQVELRPDKRPMNSDLRGSGAIEQIADVILFLYRHSVYHKACRSPNHAEILVTKQRNGPINKVDVTFKGEYTSFSNWDGGPIDLSDLAQPPRRRKASAYSSPTFGAKNYD